MDLKARLISVADAWSAAWAEAEGAEVPPTRLAKRVMDDGKFFDWLAGARKGPSTDTLEKFARFFLDPVNWPGGEVPQAARLFGAIVLGEGKVGVAHGADDIVVAAESSPDTESDPIGTVTPETVSDHASPSAARDEESPGAAAICPAATPGDLFEERAA